MRHHNNATPFGVHVESGRSIIFDRLYRPLVAIPGRWPRVKHGEAVACDPDDPRLYGIADPTLFYRPDDVNAPRCCPVVRRRLAELVRSMPALREEIDRRSNAGDLITMTFGKK